MRSIHAVAVFAAIVVLPGSNPAQNGTIIGRVIAKDADLPLGYSVVSVNPGAGEQFTAADGRFVIRGIPQGSVTITARHIAYTPLDTTLTITAGDTVNVTLALSLVTIQLPANPFARDRVCASWSSRCPGWSGARDAVRTTEGKRRAP